MRLSKISKLSMVDDILVERYVLGDSISKKYILQAINSFRIRKNEINLFKNFYLFLYHITYKHGSAKHVNFYKKTILICAALHIKFRL